MGAKVSSVLRKDVRGPCCGVHFSAVGELGFSEGKCIIYAVKIFRHAILTYLAAARPVIIMVIIKKANHPPLASDDARLLKVPSHVSDQQAFARFAALHRLHDGADRHPPLFYSFLSRIMVRITGKLIHTCGFSLPYLT